MSALVEYVSTLDRNQLAISASVAFVALFGAKKLLFGNDEYRKMLEQRKRIQTVEVAPAKPGEGGIRRSFKFRERLLEHYDPKITTGYEMFNDVVARLSSSPFLGTRKRINDTTVGDYEWESYGSISKRRDNFGAGLVGIGHKTDEPIGIYSINRPEWIITDLACQAYRCPSVALYDTLGQNAVEFVIRHAEIKTVVVAAKQLRTVLNAAKNCPLLKNIVSMDPVTEDQEKEAAALGARLFYIKDVEDQGAQKPVDHVPPRPDDIYTIMYTSGTTGDPKGVILTHGNLIAELTGIRSHEANLFDVSDVHISYLPLAHSFERATLYVLASFGAQVGFFQGNINELFNDIATLRPTFLIGAPRVWSRLYDKLLLTINSGSPIKKNLFHWGFAAKQAALKRGESSPFWDKILFSKTKARLGGRVRWIMSGSAPLDPKLGEFLKICFCCQVVEGYGLTENFAGACVTALDETQFGHVGRPLACTEVKLQDVADMGYSSKNNPPTGEIMLRGPNIFKGYYKDPEKTKEAIEPDGFFHTGDIGRWNENGTLSIIDRKKNIFKLSQGEYVAVEYLEGIYIRSKFVQQVWVYGNSYKRFLVAVVVPDKDVLMPWAKQNGFSEEFEALVSNDKIRQAVLDDMIAVGKDAKLHGFEYVKALTLTAEPFSVDNDCMTPTFKLRRNNLEKLYKNDVDRMYAIIDKLSE